MRNDSFKDKRFYDLCRKHNVAIVYAHDADFPEIDEPTADFTYARLMKAEDKVKTGYKPAELDGVFAMPTDEAWDVSERLAKEEGLLVGHSSGASLAGALRIARRLAKEGRPGVVVTLFPDRADRYFEAPVPPKLAATSEKSAT